jgi:hypothetical protein
MVEHRQQRLDRVRGQVLQRLAQPHPRGDLRDRLRGAAVARAARRGSPSAPEHVAVLGELLDLLRLFDVNAAPDAAELLSRHGVGSFSALPSANATSVASRPSATDRSSAVFVARPKMSFPWPATSRTWVNRSSIASAPLTTSSSIPVFRSSAFASSSIDRRSRRRHRRSTGARPDLGVHLDLGAELVGRATERGAEPERAEVGAAEARAAGPSRAGRRCRRARRARPAEVGLAPCSDGPDSRAFAADLAIACAVRARRRRHRRATRRTRRRRGVTSVHPRAARAADRPGHRPTGCRAGRGVSAV